VIIENVGSTETFHWGLSCLRRGGRLVLVGYDPSIPLSFNAMEMHYNEWTICGSRASTQQELMEVIDWVQRGRIKPIVYKQFTWEKANEAIQEVQKSAGVGRTVLTF
jgi:D-arabinose 1-dehydrogenase-like Zn-dependent alcohol dehydrogenase